MVMALHPKSTGSISLKSPDPTAAPRIELAAFPDAFWGELVRMFGLTLYHPTGTCRIGDVADPELQAKGVAGLRVADASIMPEISSGTPTRRAS